MEDQVATGLFILDGSTRVRRSNPPSLVKLEDLSGSGPAGPDGPVGPVPPGHGRYVTDLYKDPNQRAAGLQTESARKHLRIWHGSVQQRSVETTRIWLRVNF